MSQPNTYWRNFPQVEQLYKEGRLPHFLQCCEQSCESLDAIARSGDEREAERARMAMTAYGHTLQLLDHLANVLTAADETQTES